jgi:RNA polymerase sigma-70 factor (ECF subfamily)
MTIFRNKDRNNYKVSAVPASESDQADLIKLVVKAESGDYEAFGELYRIYLDCIFRYVVYQIKDRMTAEDITEEIFIKAWKAIDSCKGKEQTFSPWLYRIAHNYLIDTFRSTRNKSVVDIETIAEDCSNKPVVEIELEQEYWLKMISDLPQNQQQVIILKFIEGLDNQQISQVMHKNQGAIRILQMRALAKLRERLDGAENKYER